jgi:hypothetical protein
MVACDEKVRCCRFFHNRAMIVMDEISQQVLALQQHRYEQIGILGTGVLNNLIIIKDSGERGGASRQPALQSV